MSGERTGECAGCAWREGCRKARPGPGLLCLDRVPEELAAALPREGDAPGDAGGRP